MDGPLGLSQTQIDNAIASAENSLRENRSSLTSGAVGAATTAGHVLTGLLIALFSTFFLLKDGSRIWAWVVRLFPRDARARANGAGYRAWHTLISYVRATLAVAFVDAVGIGVGAALLGVPLALPLGVLVFLGPVRADHRRDPVRSGRGAGGAGRQGPGHRAVPAPDRPRRAAAGGARAAAAAARACAVSVHPLAVVLAIATGVLLAGIVGALVAVPIVVVANTVASYLKRDEEEHLAPVQPPGNGGPVPTGA